MCSVHVLMNDDVVPMVWYWCDEPRLTIPRMLPILPVLPHSTTDLDQWSTALLSHLQLSSDSSPAHISTTLSSSKDTRIQEWYIEHLPVKTKQTIFIEETGKLQKKSIAFRCFCEDDMKMNNCWKKYFIFHHSPLPHLTLKNHLLEEFSHSFSRLKTRQLTDNKAINLLRQQIISSPSPGHYQ